MSDKDEQKTQLYTNDQEQETEVYSRNDIKKTQTYESEPLTTQTYDSPHPDQEIFETKTYDSSKEIRTSEHDLGVGDTVELSGKKYKIIDIISDEHLTLEAVVYKIEDDQGKIYALKLYKDFKDPRKEPKYEALNRIKQISDPDLLKLHDFGVGDKKYRNKFCYEISEFAAGGDLLSVPDIKQKYTLEFLEQEVIPQLFNGIKKLHDYKIYHCDLKPQNVFYLDEAQTDLVIGDFGSAKILDEDSKKFYGRSSTIKSTDFYLAPELAKGVFSEKNDYFSLGMIVLHLLYPEFVNREECDKMTQRMISHKPIIDFNPEYEKFNQLIAGLTLADAEKRWGRAEVEKWLQGEMVEVFYGDFAITPIKIGKTILKSESDIVSYIEENDNWYELLIEDREGSHDFFQLFSRLRDLEEKKIFENMIRYYQQDGVKYVKEAILRYFNPERPIVIDARQFQLYQAEDLASESKNFINHIDEIYKFTSMDDLKFYLFLFEFTLGAIEVRESENLSLIAASIIEKMYAALNRSRETNFADFKAKIYPEITEESLLNIIYAFFPDRNFKDLENKQLHTLEDLAFFFATDEARFEDKFLKIEKDRFLQKLNQSDWAKLNYNQFLFRVLRSEVKSEIKFNRLEFSEDNKTWTVHYLVGYSLNEYLKKHKIKKEISAFEDDESTIALKNHIFKTSKAFFNDFLTKFLNKHNLKPDSLDKKSKQNFYQALKTEIKQHRKELAQEKLEERRQRLRMPYFFQCLLFPLPIFFIIQLLIGLSYPSSMASKFLENLGFSLISATKFSDFSQFYLHNIRLINLYILASLMPVILLYGLRLEGTVNSALKRYSMTSFLIALAFYIAATSYPIKALTIISFILGGIFVLALLATLAYWLFNFIPLLSSFLIMTALFAHFFTNVNAPNIISILLLFLMFWETARMFRAAQRFRFFQFLFVVAIYAAAFYQLGGSLFINALDRYRID